MVNCIFCKIAEGSIPSDTIFEDKIVRVFKDINPKAPVHILVIPKEHVESIAHLEDGHAQIVAHMVDTAKKVAKDYGLKGYKLVFNVGREGGQVIDHLHLHILGGWPSKEKAVGFGLELAG